MKGQFFIVGALVLVGVLSLVLITQEPLSPPLVEDLEHFSRNIKGELPRVLNFGLEVGTPAETLVNFTLLLNQTMDERAAQFTTFWVIGQGDGSGDVNFTLGNFLGTDLVASLNVSGTVKNVSIGSGSTNSTVFGSAPSQFNLTIQYSDRTATLDWQRDKANLFAFTKLVREKNIVQETWSS